MSANSSHRSRPSAIWNSSKLSDPEIRRVYRQRDPDRLSGILLRVWTEHFRSLCHLADFWIQDQEYRDPDTGQLFDRESLNAELEKIEKPAGISNPKDFRNEIVNFVLRARANNSGRNPNWTSYEKLRTVIEKKMFSNTEELLPVISFNAKTSTDEQKKHDDFVDRMMEKGYTRKQVRLLCEWYLRVRKSSDASNPAARRRVNCS